ncbi:MAG: SGNH/GDSL hydrolase family protein [Leptospira sp.]|nr:SGNH/GDSL hydrolase family protein [Leptospira sp.]
MKKKDSHLDRKILSSCLILACFIFISNCDTRKSPDQDLTANLLCYSFAQCEGTSPGTKFIMLGDSWTDLLFGTPAIQTLRYHLENEYGYKITGATLGGQRMDTVLSTGLHIQAIDQAGADARYVLLSLGGNDLQGRPSEFVADPIAERERRFAKIESNLRDIIISGNAHKMNKYGGSPLTWIIHGYDYPNPLNENSLSDTSCRSTLLRAGFQDEDIQDFTSGNLDRFNEHLRSITTRLSDLRYIDLRSTLGGPPYSDAGQMFDCIHPTSIGFRLLTDRYVRNLKFWTGEDK